MAEPEKPLFSSFPRYLMSLADGGAFTVWPIVIAVIAGVYGGIRLGGGYFPGSEYAGAAIGAVVGLLAGAVAAGGVAGGLIGLALGALIDYLGRTVIGADWNLTASAAYVCGALGLLIGAVGTIGTLRQSLKRTPLK